MGLPTSASSMSHADTHAHVTQRLIIPGYIRRFQSTLSIRHSMALPTGFAAGRDHTIHVPINDGFIWNAAGFRSSYSFLIPGLSSP